MKRRSAWVAMVVGMAGVVATLPRARVQAADEPSTKSLSGTWSCVQHTPGTGDRPFELALVQDGKKVAGTVHVSEGDAAVRGTLDAEGFTLEVESDSGTYTVSGKMAGDSLGGTWVLGTVQGTWDGKRKAAS